MNNHIPLPHTMGQGVLSVLEGIYSVRFGNKAVGRIQVKKQGLYYCFSCRCKLPADTVCRLQVVCGDRQENLGIVVPIDDGFGLETKIPIKRFVPGQPEFSLQPKHSETSNHFAAVYPEEPFAYITRLKDAYLVKKDGQVGILLK